MIVTITITPVNKWFDVQIKKDKDNSTEKLSILNLKSLKYNLRKVVGLDATMVKEIILECAKGNGVQVEYLLEDKVAA